MMMILLSQGRHGIPNVSNELSPCYAHRGETGTKKSAQVLTQKIDKCPFTLLHPGVKHCPLDPGIKPQPLVYSAVHWPTSHKLLSLNSATGLQCSALTNQPQTPVIELSHWVYSAVRWPISHKLLSLNSQTASLWTGISIFLFETFSLFVQEFLFCNAQILILSGICCKQGAIIQWYLH